MAIETFLSLAQAAGHGPIPLESKSVTVRSDAAMARWYAEHGFRGLADSYSYGTMSPDRALQCGAFYAGIKFLGEDMGSLPLFLMRRSGKRGTEETREKFDDHPLFETLHDQFNPHLTAMEGREALTAHAAMCGDGYAQIIRGVYDLRLYPLMPWDVRMEVAADWTPTYWVMQRGGIWKPFPASEIFHLRGFNLSGQHGVNILSIARDVLKLALEQTDYAKAFFERDHTPGVVVEHPKGVGPEGVEGIKKAWREHVQSHDVAVLQEGAKLNRIGQTNVESQLTEQRIEQVLEVARLLRMPPHKFGIQKYGGYASVEQHNIQYVTETLRPWAVRWEQAIRRCLLTPAERRELYAEHALEAILRGDFRSQAEAWARLLEKGVYSINDVLRMLNMNPVEGGEERFIQLNMTTIQNAATGQQQELPARVGG